MLCKECVKERELQIKLEEGKEQENFIAYVEYYFQLTPSDEQKGIRELHQDFKKQTYNRQTNSHHYSFCEIFEHSNGIASTIYFKCNRKKHDKRLINHQFNLHTPQQTINHSGDLRYRASNWYSINFQWVFGMQIIGGGGRESTKLLGMLNLPWKEFENKPFQTLKKRQAWQNYW